jgi:prolyl oligopeptidase
MSKSADRYLWLENLGNKRVTEWFAKRDRASRKLLRKVSGKLKPRIEHYYSVPYAFLVRTSKKGHFLLLREAGRFRVKLVTSDGFANELVDSTELGKDIVLQWIYASDEGDLFAFSYSVGGSDEGILKVVETDSGEVLDELKGVISDIVWRDGDRYYYGRFYQKEKTPDGVAPPTVRIFLREDGRDEMVFGSGVPTSHFLGLKKSTQGSRALLTLSYGWTKSDVYGGKLDDPEKWDCLYGKGDFVAWPVDYSDGEYLAASFDEKGFGRIVAIDEKRKAREIVGEQPYPLQEAVVSGNRIVASYLANASSMLKTYSLKTAKAEEIKLQPNGSIDSLDSNGRQCVFRYESFFIPHRIYVLKGDELRVLDSVEIQKQLAVEEFWVRSRDSTRIHAFRVGKTDEGRSRVLAWGYGGFGVSITPRFYPHVIPFLEDGGTFVAANLRGGKELGEQWHRRGMRDKKQNVFDDFMAVLELLKAEGSKVMGFGGSNGGLLIGAVLTQRPELLDGAVIGYPVLDMLRFHKLHIGKAWVPEYGDPDDPKDAEFLRRYSPYHNLTKQEYPPIMFYTGLHDDRVHPAHALKFAARLEEVGGSCLLRVETKSGHSGATPTTKIEEYSDVMAFVYRTLGINE